jgi:hypothetical protein
MCPGDVKAPDLKGKKLLKAYDTRKVARECEPTAVISDRSIWERERERERGMASGQEKNFSIGF